MRSLSLGMHVLAMMVFLVCGTPLTATASSICSEIIAKGNILYQEMNYTDSAQLLKQVLADPTLCNTKEQAEVHVLLSKLELVKEDRTAAIAEMKSALKLDSFISLDPQTTSPKVIQVLHEARQLLEKETTDTKNTETKPANKEPSGTRIAAWATLGLGSTSALASGTCMGMALNENRQQKDAASRDDWDARDTHWQNTKNLAMSSYVLAGSAALLLGISTYLFLTSTPSTSKTNVSGKSSDFLLMPTASPEEAGFLMRLRF